MPVSPFVGSVAPSLSSAVLASPVVSGGGADVADPILPDTAHPLLMADSVSGGGIRDALSADPSFGNTALGVFTAPGRALGAVRSLVPGSGGAQLPGVDPKYQEHLTTLQNKYRKLSDVVGALSPEQRDGLLKYDARRVSSGSAPLTEGATLKVVQTLKSGSPATPARERSPFDFLDNVRSDLSDLVKSVPRIPFGIAREIGDLPHFSERVQENESAGMNSVAAILNAPGVRMIPGAFLAGQAARGGAGLRELATHPLFAGLDALPFANKAAASSEIGRLSREVTDAAGLPARPLRDVLVAKAQRDATGGVLRDPESELPILGRSKLGAAMDFVRDETAIGQGLDAFGGKRSRRAGEVRQGLENRARAVQSGMIDPRTPVEQLAANTHKFLSKWESVYPELSSSLKATPENAQRAADFYNAVQRDPSRFDPEFVADAQSLALEHARHLQGEGLLDLHNGEWYDMPVARRLNNYEAGVRHRERMVSFMPHLHEATSPDVLHQMAQDVVSSGASRAHAVTEMRTVTAAFDAAGHDVSAATKAIGAFRDSKGTLADWRDTLASAPKSASPRSTMADLLKFAKSKYNKDDPMVAQLRTAVALGDRKLSGQALRNLASRKPPTIPESEWAAVRDDMKGLADRMKLSRDLGKKYSEKKAVRAREGLAEIRAKNPSARFMPLVQDEKRALMVERLREWGESTFGRPLSPDEVAQVVRGVTDRSWRGIPGVDEDAVVQIARQAEWDAKRMWVKFRENGQEPLFVHHVSPGRANQTQTINVGPVAFVPSQSKGRILDLSTGVQDLRVALTHQSSELLQREANEAFLDEIVKSVGVTEKDLRDKYLPEAHRRALRDPDLDVEGHLDRILKRGYEKFNPDEVGLNWGGINLSKYNQDAVYIPKSLAGNLKNYQKPPSLAGTIMDPVTRLFRLNVIGLSLGVIVNNFFSNSVAVMAESGPGALARMGEAAKMLKDPRLIPNEDLRATVMAEHHQADYLHASWKKARTGNKLEDAAFMQGVNAYHAFRDSVVAEAAKKGMSAVEAVAEKSMQLQQLGDNVYRVAQYLFERDKALKKGASLNDADHAAMQMVKRTLVDYGRFTQVERSAMRTIIPFYSYMGHAARFIMRYPFDHPLRAEIVGSIAQAERERLGALPGGYLSMVPIPDWVPLLGGKKGDHTMLSLRPFSPFGDISDLASLSGWAAAANPVIQTALGQFGVSQGEQELYPTTRYNPTTGRMEAVKPGFASSFINNTMPRLGFVSASLGLNPEFNELKAAAPDAAARRIVSLAGLPRVWRGMSPVQDIIKGEVARQTDANDVKNKALKSGDWNDALRYPSLREAYAQLAALGDSDQVRAAQPATPTVIKQLIEQSLG